MQPKQNTIGVAEFVALMAMMMALVALSIDMILPALPLMAADLNVGAQNSRQHIISILFLGITIGQVIYGPLSDSIGRKRSVCVGMLTFMVGTLIAGFAHDFEAMLLGRLLQGLGVAAMRVVTVAMVRDLYRGDEMARIMSFIMSIFILVPMIAPLLGQGVLALSGWRANFAVFGVLAACLFAWYWTRQEETLALNKRIPLNLRTLCAGVKEVSRNRVTLGYTLIIGLVTGAFLGYLVSSQQVLQEFYETDEWFPVLFGLLALAIGSASLLNAKMVMRFGMQRLITVSAVGVSLISSVVLLTHMGDQPTLRIFLLSQGMILFFVGLSFGNLNAMALQPLGHIAGIATSWVSFVSGCISVTLGWIIGSAFDASVVPLFVGFLAGGVGSLIIIFWVNRKRVNPRRPQFCVS